MQKQYIAIYKNKEYEIQDIIDMIQPYNVRYWHREQTLDSPEEEDIDYKFDVSSDFDKAVKIACVEFKDDNDNSGKYVEFDGMRFWLCQSSWFECLQSYGWNIFTNIINLEEFQESEIKVRLKLDEWINTIAEGAAWNIVYNGEARSW